MEIEANRQPIWCIEKLSSFGSRDPNDHRWIRADLHTAVVKNGRVTVGVRPQHKTATYDVLLDVLKTAATQWEFFDPNQYRIRNTMTGDFIMGCILR